MSDYDTLTQEESTHEAKRWRQLIRVAGVAGLAMPLLTLAPVIIASTAAPASAGDPARERELTCTDGTVFVGEQVRMGAGTPPRVWRNVEPGGSPAAYSFHAALVTAPDGTVLESDTWDHAAGVDRQHELVVCSFVIPIGPLTGHTATFEGFFVA